MPFSNGTQFMDWIARNCDRCSRCKVNEHGEDATECDLWDALQAACEAEPVPAEVLSRIGYKPGAYTWDCPERNCSRKRAEDDALWEAAKRDGLIR